MLLNQSIKLSLVTAAVVEGLSDRGSDKKMQLNCSSATAEAVATETAVLLLKQLSSN
jgi:hypothetical protein